MIRTRIEEMRLNPEQKGHVFGELLPGAYLSSGGLAFAGRSERSHTNDGPDGRDFHVHDDREAFLILQGIGTMEINGEHHPVRAGDIVIVEPGENHHLCSDAENPIVTLW
ncbi:cupin domain-containing protein, partial [Paenibacillus sepulcri]|nr:cupin domain-containing protein [Paenibacillus sepulcri]